MCVVRRGLRVLGLQVLVLRVSDRIEQDRKVKVKTDLLQVMVKEEYSQSGAGSSKVKGQDSNNYSKVPSPSGGGLNPGVEYSEPFKNRYSAQNTLKLPYFIHAVCYRIEVPLGCCAGSVCHSSIQQDG